MNSGLPLLPITSAFLLLQWSSGRTKLLVRIRFMTNRIRGPKHFPSNPISEASNHLSSAHIFGNDKDSHLLCVSTCLISLPVLIKNWFFPHASFNDYWTLNSVRGIHLETSLRVPEKRVYRRWLCRVSLSDKRGIRHWVWRLLIGKIVFGASSVRLIIVLFFDRPLLLVKWLVIVLSFGLRFKLTFHYLTSVKHLNLICHEATLEACIARHGWRWCVSCRSLISHHKRELKECIYEYGSRKKHSC